MMALWGPLNDCNVRSDYRRDIRVDGGLFFCSKCGPKLVALKWSSGSGFAECESRVLTLVNCSTSMLNIAC